MKNIFVALVVGLANTAYAQLLKGTARTGRSWDCSPGFCGCGWGNSQALTSCHSNSMFAAPAGNEYGAKFYGSTGISEYLAGQAWQVKGCGKCFKVTAESNVAGMPKFNSTVVLKATNVLYQDKYTPTQKEMAYFDIAAPGFDSNADSTSLNCTTNGEEKALHMPQICRFWPYGNARNCKCNFVSKVLQAGCENFLSLLWSQPKVTYEELAECPKGLAHTPPCYADNGNMWPEKPAATCTVPAGPGPSPTGCPGGSEAACLGLCSTVPPASLEACVKNCGEKCVPKEPVDWISREDINIVQ